MFLKTVPPVLAIHAEWRSSKSCSLPLFFNDSASDSDLASASGTPFPQKIQMIIESLHSTQSSDMSDNVQTEKAAHSSHETGFKSQMRVMDMSVISRRQGTETKLWNAGSDTGEDSDSDDSVDRGIEEAIQEYLKEKVDHKRKGDPVTSPSPAPKLQRREPSVPDAAKQHTHSSSGKVLTASNHIQKASTGVLPLKKKVKKKKLSKENPFKKTDTSKVLPMKIPPPSRGKKGSSSSSEMDRSPSRLVIKEEEEWLDSSSDDGIEEEIQRFQQEKKDKQAGGKDALRSSQKNDDSDSSSEEGIEKAICCFQEEKHQQKKKKSPLKPAQLVPAQCSKPDIVSPEHTSIQPLKTMSKKNKKKVTAKKSDHPTPLAVSHFLNKCSSQNSKVRGFTVSPMNLKQTHTEHQISTSLKVNTAELMCAEAILDISKTVMPEEFDSNLSITNRNLLQTPTFLPIAPSDDKSEDSSVDSEDGIEQEIRKFLELKAKMNKEPPTTTAAPSPGLGDPMAGKEPKKKMKETQPNKVARLSLSRKRKFKEEQSKLFRDGDMVCNVKEEPSGKLLVHSDATRSQISSAEHSTMTSHSSCLTGGKNNKPKQTSPSRKITDVSIPKGKGSRYSSSSPTNSSRTLIGSERNDSSDKSSSLDSDEDLDAAIKDLLKTKKKVKKKVRDINARKGVRTLETSSLDTKHKPSKEKKSIPPAKAVKSCVLKGGKETLNVQAKDKGFKSKTVKSKSEVQESLTRTDRVTGNGGILNASTPDCDLPSSNPRADDVPDEDSSVDSDDSIEQEIRRFLAQRAKVVAPTAASIKQEEDVGESLTSTAEFGVKSEHQQIPVETLLSASTEASGRLRNDEECWEQESMVAQRQMDSPAEFDKGPVLTPGSSCIMGFRRTVSQKFEISTTRDPKNSTPSQEGKDVFSNKATPASDTIISTFFPTPSVGSGMPQHQNLFLMRPVNSSMSEVKECSSTDCKELAFSHQSRLAPRTPLKDVISSICPSPASKTKPPMNFPTENPGVATGDLSTPRSRTEGLNLHNHMKTEKRDRYLSDKPHLSPSVSHLCQPSPVLQPILGSSETQVERDQTVQKSNPLQVKQTETSESKTSLEERHREGGSDSKEEKVQAREEQEDEEQKCVDETDVESDKESKGQKVKGRRKQLPNQNLSTSVDPGFLLSPYIALDTEERCLKFQARCLQIQQQLQMN
ncbi:protein phosphatase 1 regulatory subunit 26-like [Myxocyprinus asiaticus]|uniref:protein phosphatase 1 regulatory subunit 26-like n=1 Tax=Myxocyprinus asiaticus TaxID=70543 RepID=UPI002221E2E2|nr:protein phosphatase 1 regulatory subunit 26-like [Myxocyprinus asiaticus]